MHEINHIWNIGMNYIYGVKPTIWFEQIFLYIAGYIVHVLNKIVYTLTLWVILAFLNLPNKYLSMIQHHIKRWMELIWDDVDRHTHTCTTAYR